MPTPTTTPEAMKRFEELLFEYQEAVLYLKNSTSGTREALRAHVSKMAEDARRYQFLRNNPPVDLCVRYTKRQHVAPYIYTDGENLDALIDDAAREGTL